MRIYPKLHSKSRDYLYKMHLQTINMLLVRKLHDVAENWVLTFELLVGGNLHIFEILVFQKGFLGGYNAVPKDFI